MFVRFIFFFPFFLYCLTSWATNLTPKNWVSNVDPMMSPEFYYLLNSDQISRMPDGTGLQILFASRGHYYLLAGPRVNRLLTVNGGKIEKPQAPFFEQLQEEFEEETFGVMQIFPGSGLSSQSFQLLINDRPYPLQILTESTLIHDSPSKFVYVTFTGLVPDFSVKNLDKLANHLTPTSLFWEKLGSYLHQHTRKAPKDETFVSYWQSQQDGLNQVLSDLSQDYDRLIRKGGLLITPEQAFQVNTIDDAWNVLRQLNSYSQLKYHAQNTVGRYSERKGYYVIDAQSVLDAVQFKDKSVRDIHGRKIADSVFNTDAVQYIFPLFLNKNVFQPRT